MKVLRTVLVLVVIINTISISFYTKAEAKDKVDDLIEKIKSEKILELYEAMIEVKKINDPRAFDQLVILLNDQRLEVQFIAAWALGELGDKRAV